jgi:CRP-like cAMP-binding protein
MDRTSPADTLLKRLRISADINEADERAIRRLPINIKRIGGNEPIVSFGDRPPACCLVVEGFVLRSKNVGEGERQILAFHQPGDIPDLQSLYLHIMDHDVSSMAECVLGFIAHGPLRSLVRSQPNIAEVLWRDTLIDAALFREWICNVGQRSGASRLAHLVVEIYTRLKAVGLVNGLSFDFPVTQVLLGEAVGLSTVHVNRVLQQLRGEGLLEIDRGTITILDETRLKNKADFDPLYLHLNPSL